MDLGLTRCIYNLGNIAFGRGKMLEKPGKLPCKYMPSEPLGDEDED